MGWRLLLMDFTESLQVVWAFQQHICFQNKAKELEGAKPFQ